MTRLLWNGDYCAYISDVVVDAAYRGRDLASYMINMVIEHLKENMEEGYAGAALDMWIEK